MVKLSLPGYDLCPLTPSPPSRRPSPIIISLLIPRTNCRYKSFPLHRPVVLAIWGHCLGFIVSFRHFFFILFKEPKKGRDRLLIPNDVLTLSVKFGISAYCSCQYWGLWHFNLGKGRVRGWYKVTWGGGGGDFDEPISSVFNDTLAVNVRTYQFIRVKRSNINRKLRLIHPIRLYEGFFFRVFVVGHLSVIQWIIWYPQTHKMGRKKCWTRKWRNTKLRMYFRFLKFEN